MDSFYNEDNVLVEESQSNEDQKRYKIKDIFEGLEVVVVAIVATVLIFSFIFRIATIDGDSMQSTLFHGEKVVISNLFYTPKAGDIVVISRNIENSSATTDASALPIIKRIIATEGQTVDIDFDKGIVYVDGEALSEPYANTKTNLKYDIEFPVIVKEGCVFVLGDNRNNSLDSRSSQIGENGMIDTRYILGRAIVRVLPLNKFGGFKDD